jgi:hypothetical protein
MAKDDELSSPVTSRRNALRDCGMETSVLPDDETLGIAFSGGGIRSATIALGVAQALARHKRLLAFDYMSTVSGGGYFGSFLRSLYVPPAARGPTGTTAECDAGRFAFANAVLESEPHERTVASPEGGAARLANPIWWLREHSRYLAPNGATDFAFAASHVARNWMAMLYVFVVAMAALSVLQLGVVGFVVSKLGAARIGEQWPWFFQSWGTVSLLGAPAAALLFLAVAAGVAFWMTEAMHVNPSWLYRRRDMKSAARQPHLYFLGTWIATALALAGTYYVVVWNPAALPWMTGLGDIAPPARTLFRWGCLFVLVMLIWAMAGFLWVVVYGETKHGFADGVKRLFTGRLTINPTGELRRVLTLWMTYLNVWFGVFAGLALIDTAAIWLHDNGAVPTSWGGVSALSATVVLPVGAYLIKKVPEWLGKFKKGGKQRIPPALVRGLTLFVGVMLFAITAVLADAVVHRALWTGPAIKGQVDAATFALFALIIAVLTVLTGRSDGFINLSSLHGIYASRLTRAYLGATNVERLAARGTHDARLGHGSSAVSVNKSQDYIDTGLYQRAKLPAPIHLINVTLNETIGSSSLVDRARKGFLATFAPEGVIIDAKTADHPPAADWNDLRDGHSEPLSVGQLCAISGAAASAGMGRMTTLGGALSFTFANVRLGYWWFRGRALRKPWTTPRWSRLAGPVETFVYLFNEMTARYSRSYRRLYLSDGGHFENSGALELVRRGVRMAIVCDNGADPELTFGDLEILIRTARLDLGRHISVATAHEVAALVGRAKTGTSLFFNGAEGDWRAVAQGEGGDAFALLLNINVAEGLTTRRTGQIIWLKPRRIGGLSEDVEGYIDAHPAFPHESTGDQFFDEAQWESYRRLGVEMAHRLIDRTNGLWGAIPAIKPMVKVEAETRISRSPSPRPARRRASPA